jgi:hypothetical protein
MDFMKRLQTNEEINLQTSGLLRQLTALDRKAQRFDRILRDVRIEIYDTFWHLIEVKNKELHVKKITTIVR